MLLCGPRMPFAVTWYNIPHGLLELPYGLCVCRSGQLGARGLGGCGKMYLVLPVPPLLLFCVCCWPYLSPLMFSFYLSIQCFFLVVCLGPDTLFTYLYNEQRVWG